MKIINKIIFVILLFLQVYSYAAIKSSYTISGYIKDGSNGEVLIGATVYVNEIGKGTITNTYGYYSLTLPEGGYTISYSYIGFNSTTQKIELNKDYTNNIELASSNETLQEVVVTTDRPQNNVLKAEMSTIKIDMKTIKAVPAMVGEVDPIRVVQLLPGVNVASEGSTGFSVRGGALDQNLVLLDEATVYNPSHLMGFLSVFNNDAIKNIKLYKADIPAQFGGRLSSLMDVQMRDGNNKKYEASGGIGLLTSRLTFEGPIVKEKGSFIISGRRAYIDAYKLFTSDTDIKNATFYFYDLNLKANYILSNHDKLFVSGYLGRDVIGYKESFFNWGNQTLTLRWNHLFSDRLFCNTSLIFSNYDYTLGTKQVDTKLNWLAGMKEYSLKHDYSFYLNPNNTIRFGLQSIYHTFQPGKIESTGYISGTQIQNTQALESALYISNEQKIGNHLTLDYGLRYSVFSNIGPYTKYRFNRNFNYTDSVAYSKNQFYNTYAGLDAFEPRLSLNYVVNDESSIKASYTRTRQFIQKASNSVVGVPLDIWVPSSPNIKPQLGDQYAMGYFRNFIDQTLETSVEVFYKDMKQQIDFKDYASLLLNPKIEGEFRFGTAKAYGIEFLVRKQVGKMQGWIGYTYSRVKRYFPDINGGKPYSAPYDKPNSVTTVFMYTISDRIDFSATWVYSSGTAITLPAGKFEFSGEISGIVTDRNSYRMPDYHRLDLGLIVKQKEKPGRKFFSEWNFSIYNVYNRKNAWIINLNPDPKNPNIIKATMTSLFPFIPAASWNFRF
jgi:hypothetical protein